MVPQPFLVSPSHVLMASGPASDRIASMETLSQYRKRLSKLKVKKLGGGWFSDVYQHPTLPDVAVKIVHRKDPKYVEYARECMSLQNPWLPRVYGIETREVQWKGKAITLTFVFLEKLKRAKYLDRVESVKKFSRSAIDFDDVNWRRVRRNKDPEIRQVGKLLTKLEANDLQDCNVMLRGKQIVFTDPVASGEE